MLHSTFSSAETTPRRVGVVVADNQPLVRAGIRAELARHHDIEVYGEAPTSNDALRLAKAHGPDVLVLDINIPGTPVVEVLRQISALPQPTHVLVLTVNHDIQHVLTVLKAGATSYMLKDDDSTTIAAAIRATARGEAWMSGAVMGRLVEHTIRGDKTAESQLSSREVDVLEQLITGKDNQDIGKALCISERTVRFHLRNIYDKLGMRRGETIAWGVRQGLGERVPM